MTVRASRAKPTMIKAGVTKNRKRKYCGGGKIYKAGGKLKGKCKC